jgi:glycosyltransferase involved in cell wall biosynthesis
MASKIKILVDSFFPYDIKAPDMSISPITERRGNAWRRIFFPHFIDLYVSSFQFDAVLTSRKHGKFLGLLYMFYKPPRLKHVIYEFIFERRRGWRGKVSWFIWKFLIKKIDRVLVQSASETIWYSKLFGVGREKFIFVPVAVNTSSGYIGPSAGGHIFSAGRTNRDYDTLLEVLMEVNAPCVIVTGSKDRSFLRNLPSHISVYFDLDKERYKGLLAGSRLVILALKQGASSRGQVALLEAMALGKPVICSNVPGVRDYAEDKASCLLVPPENAPALKDKVTWLLKSEADLHRIGKSGYERAKKLFGYDRFLINFKSAVNETLRN